MSLIITSNVSLENRPDTSNVYRPFSYTNHLGNALKIKKNSQIALQSAKINKVDRFIINRQNGVFCNYFGVDVSSGAAAEALNLNGVTSAPMMGTIGNMSGIDSETMSPDDVAKQIEVGIEASIHHPSLLHSTGVDVDTKYASGLFAGYTYTFTQLAATTADEVPDQAFRNIAPDGFDNGTATDDDAGTITTTAVAGSRFYRQYTKYPISQNYGDAIFDVTGANLNHTNCPFRVGLSRYNFRTEPNGRYKPNYAANQNLALPQNNFSTNEFYDIVVYRKAELLHVAQSCTNAAGELILRDIQYWGGFNANFAAQVNWRDDRATYTKVKFVIRNEKMNIYLWDTTAGPAAYVLLIDNVLSNTKNQHTTALNQCQWYLYPTMATKGRAGTAINLQLDSTTYYTHLTANGNQDATSDWWISLQNRGLQRWGRDIEIRPWNNHTVADYLAAKDVNFGNGYMTDYTTQIISSPSSVYGADQTVLVNAGNILGFTDVSPAPSTAPTPALVMAFVSAEKPKIVSNVALFVRLNNFGHQVVNAKQGTQTSKIIAMMPRFDHSGNDTGGLYFEPNQKTYIDLNNANDLYINTLDIDIVYDNETLCDALTGKTIVVLHIRDKK